MPQDEQWKKICILKACFEIIKFLGVNKLSFLLLVHYMYILIIHDIIFSFIEFCIHIDADHDTIKIEFIISIKKFLFIYVTKFNVWFGTN